MMSIFSFLVEQFLLVSTLRNALVSSKECCSLIYNTSVEDAPAKTVLINVSQTDKCD